VWGEKDSLHQYSFNTTTNQFDTTPVHSGNIVGNPDNMPGAMISISANGNSAGTGILWITMPSPEIDNAARDALLTVGGLGHICPVASSQERPLNQDVILRST
jgi:hypothetical protein